MVGARQFLSSDARKIPGNLPCLCRVRWEQCLRESPRVTQVEAGNMENDLINRTRPRRRRPESHIIPPVFLAFLSLLVQTTTVPSPPTPPR